MAEVYRAKASGAGGFEKQMAIKRILPNDSSNEEFRKMFEYEARLSSTGRRTPILCRSTTLVKSGETYLLAMEFVNGKEPPTVSQQS
jgi:serine/threonine-protein kinase